MKEQKVYKSIFTSHASLDKEIVNYFIDDILIGSLGFNITDIFSTSTDGAKITSGEDWRNEIRDNILNAKVIFLFVTSNYKCSEMCLNEMGAAWATSNKVISIIVEPINFNTVGILQEIKQIEKLNDETSLDRIKDEMQALFKIPSGKIKSDRWTAKKREFLTKLKIHLKNNPFPIPVSKDVLQDLSQQLQELNESYEKLLKEKVLLDKINKDLVKEKGIQAAKKIKLKHGVITEFQEFKDILKEVRDTFGKLDSATTTIVFNDFTGNNLKIDYQAYSAGISKSIARKYIDEEESVLWEGTVVIKNIDKALTKLSSFMKKVQSVEFFEEYEDNYEALFDIKNLDFWEDVISVNMAYE